MTKTNSTTSPPWSRNTKLVITLVFVVILGALIIRFQSLLGPVIFSFFIAYLLHPVAKFLDNKVIHGWRASVSILYLLFVILLITLLTWGGLNLLQQVQSLIKLIQTNITQLPQLINDIFSKVYQIGPFTIDFTSMDLSALGQDILGAVQPLLGNLGNFVGSLATSAAGIFGWLAFILIVSYFILLESGGLRNRIIHVDFPGYTEDISRMRSSLGRIWNAFLRGQIIIFLLAVGLYSILLPILGVRYALGLALMAGLAKFLPYIGPAITWVVMGVVTFFQPFKPFGLNPLLYTGIVVIVTLSIDQIIDTLITPRIMARTLKVHPAAVLVAALIAANLLGLLGVVIAAPFLATIMLLGRYVMRKMFELDPWPPVETELQPSVGMEWIARIKRLRRSFTTRREEVMKSDKENSNEQ